MTGEHSIEGMRARVAFLRGQADQFRELARGTHDETLRARFLELAKNCAEIADNIEQNLAIHGRYRPKEEDDGSPD